MSTHAPLENVVTGRISNETKCLMDSYGFNVRDAINGYLKIMGSPTKTLELKRELLMEDITKLKWDLIAAEMKLEEIDKQLQEHSSKKK